MSAETLFLPRDASRLPGARHTPVTRSGDVILLSPGVNAERITYCLDYLSNLSCEGLRGSLAGLQRWPKPGRRVPRAQGPDCRTGTFSGQQAGDIFYL